MISLPYTVVYLFVLRRSFLFFFGFFRSLFSFHTVQWNTHLKYVKLQLNCFASAILVKEISRQRRCALTHATNFHFKIIFISINYLLLSLIDRSIGMPICINKFISDIFHAFHAYMYIRWCYQKKKKNRITTIQHGSVHFGSNKTQSILVVILCVAKFKINIGCEVMNK